MRSYSIQDYRSERWSGFKDYYVKMMYSGDCDPAYPALNYVCDRTEANPEQRYWIAWLYGTSYCAPTSWFMFNEFPDFENVDVPRMQRWWDAHKHETFFQTDRAKVKNFNYFVRCFESYRKVIGNSQVDAFSQFKKIADKRKRYRAVYDFTSKLFYFGRFTLFNYLEAINELTDLKMEPDELDFKEAESSRNGMCYVCEHDDMVTEHHKKSKSAIDYNNLQADLEVVIKELKHENPEIEVNYWNVETCLCAYKKLFWDARYLGYYIDRMLEEIQWLQAAVPHGVDWQILYNFREEFFDRKYLGEIQGWDGIRKREMKNVTETGQLLQSVPRIGRYVRRVVFPSIGDIYQTKVSPTISVQIAKGEEWKPVIETICKAVDNPAVKSFPNIWTRFENWDKQPPYVAKMEDVVVGFMGLTINKGEYVNFYDFAVTPRCQHMGVGSALWEAALIVAREAGKTRIKCSADERYGGFPFYTRKLHWAPIAKKGHEYKFDAFIEGVGSVREFIMSRKRDLVQPPDKELEKYKKMDEFYGETKELNEANNKTGLAMWM